MMFNVGDRVRVERSNFKEFVGLYGNIINYREYHDYRVYFIDFGKEIISDRVLLTHRGGVLKGKTGCYLDVYTDEFNGDWFMSNNKINPYHTELSKVHAGFKAFMEKLKR